MTDWEVNTEINGTNVRLQLGAMTYTIPPDEATTMAAALATAAEYAKHNRRTQ